MTEITISAVVRIADSKYPEIDDNSIQVINIDKIKDKKITIKDKKKLTTLNYTDLVNGYISEKYMILYIKKKWVYIFSTDKDLYYFYNSNSSNDKIDISDIQALFRSKTLEFFCNNEKIEEPHSKYDNIKTFFNVPSGEKLHNTLEDITVKAKS